MKVNNKYVKFQILTLNMLKIQIKIQKINKKLIIKMKNKMKKCKKKKTSNNLNMMINR